MYHEYFCICLYLSINFIYLSLKSILLIPYIRSISLYFYEGIKNIHLLSNQITLFRI